MRVGPLTAVVAPPALLPELGDAVDWRAAVAAVPVSMLVTFPPTKFPRVDAAVCDEGGIAHPDITAIPNAQVTSRLIIESCIMFSL